jgi:hypothetical protein
MSWFLAVETGTLLLFLFRDFSHIYAHAVFWSDMVPFLVQEFEEIGFHLC